jgi:hypothetical protein
VRDEEWGNRQWMRCDAQTIGTTTMHSQPASAAPRLPRPLVTTHCLAQQSLLQYAQPCERRVKQKQWKWANVWT